MCTTFAAYRSWWADVAPRRPETTARTYRYHVLRFLADTRSDPTTIRHGEVERYLAGLSNQHRSAVRSALADLFGFCHRRGLRAENPLADAAPVRRRSRAQRKALEPEELIRLVVAAVWLGHGRERWTGERTAWGILAQYASGARPGELALLCTEDLSLNGRASSVYVRATKTGTDRTVPLGPLGRDAFGELARGRAGRLLGVGTPEWWRKIRRAALAAGIPASKAKPYCLRHSAATHMLERGAPMRVVAEILGHVDIRTTMGYTIPRDDERRRAVDLLG